MKGGSMQNSGPFTKEFPMQRQNGQADAGTQALWEGMGSYYHIVSFRVEIAVVLRGVKACLFKLSILYGQSVYPVCASVGDGRV